MKQKRTILSYVIYLISYSIGCCSFAQNTPYYIFSPTLQTAYSEVFKLKINSARQLIAQEKSQTAFSIYVENYADIVTLLISDEKRMYEQLSDNQDKRLDVLEDMPANSPYYRFLQAEVRLHWAFVKLKFGKEIAASWDIIKAYRLLDENAKKYPDFLPTYKSLGLLHVLIGSTPQNYQWVAKLLGLRGNIQQGLREIRMVIQKDKIFGNEAQLLELLIYAHILSFEDRENAQLLQYLQAHEDNLLLNFFGVTISMKDGRGEQALALLSQQPRGSHYLSLPIMDYLRGENLLQKGDYGTARTYLNKFLMYYRGQNFVKDTYLMLFLSHWLAGDETAGKPYLYKIDKVGIAYVESDKAAQKIAESFRKGRVSVQQKILMKARLAFDGGYYDAALALLKPYQEQQFALPYDKAEFQYRLGRIVQRQNQPIEAKKHFERAISLSQAEGFYFGATSALQLGYIYQSLGKNQEAIAYFRQTLDFPKHEYKNSVDNKARAALTQMGVE
ncbi:MAG: tetratricopeptide repeat protein [Spirosomataceae bacterium]